MMRRALLAIAAVAFVLGLIARLKGLAVAPLAVDEFYIVRSVDNVLRTGLPKFLCGGWYGRGLTLQYGAAALELMGVAPVVAVRLVAAISSLLALPAAFLIARRLYDASVAWLVVSILSISVWEIAMARFGRMYAPFQAVFLWYAVFFIRYGLDRDRKALGMMALLSVVGLLTWEGGVFLPAANLLALFGFAQRPRWSLRLGLETLGLVGLAAFGYWLNTGALPVSNAALDFPSVSPPVSLEGGRGLFDLAPQPLTLSLSHPGWLLGALLPIIAVGAALPWVLRFRSRPLTVLGLLLVLLAALCGQFAAAGAALALLVVYGWLAWPEILSPAARRLHLALLACLVYWLAFTAVAIDWRSLHAGSAARTLALFVYELARLPDFFTVALWPWARTLPVLGLALSILLVVAFVRITRAGGGAPSAERVAFALFLSMLVLTALTEPPRVETRYTFFLYPLGIILALGTLWQLVPALMRGRRGAPVLAAGIALFGFAATEDYNHRFLFDVERAASVTQAGADPNMASHLVIRPDAPAMASWLREHVTRGRDVVISGYQSLDFYYPGVDYFFVDWREESFYDWACRHGTLERWTNRPLLYTEAALESTLRPHPRGFLVVYTDQEQRLLQDLARYAPRVVWSSDFVSIIELSPAAGAG
ncbi:MAG TPA: glycosyltransferase family 39 protein [Steroidobacteraceae bacterium]|nr:glycosyltransferase family 39 protein [Steroidobacteraceae bacterium]